MINDDDEYNEIFEAKKFYPEEPWLFEIPIVIPSLKRYAKMKKQRMMIDTCLSNLFKFYNATDVHVIAQEYEEEDKKFLMERFPQVTWVWFEKRMGIVGTFNIVKELGTSLGDWYIHYDDDVKMTQQFDDNPTLLAYQNIMEIMPDRVGVVTVPSISIHHFTKSSERLFNLHSNPAQLVLINSKAAKDCIYDTEFENFRSDTDFTMQLASKRYIPVMLTKFFSFMHTIPISIIDKASGKKRFKILDNVTQTKGSIGGDRRVEIKMREYDAFQKKWPRVITHKNYRQQVLKKSVIHLTGFVAEELLEIERQFDWSLVNNFHYDYYDKDLINKIKSRNGLI